MKLHTGKFSIIVVFLAGFLTMQASVAATVAGKVVFAQGQPQAIDTAGTERILARGNEVFSGDQLITGAGRLQISLLDGAFVSVQPNTEYQIENYNYSGSPDGTEIASYRLHKGGVRAVTGLIGRQNPEAYKVHTAVATIGIRGTGHNTRICQGDCGSRPDGLYHNTWEGITYVVNDVDAQDVPTGRGVYVQDIEAEIQFLDQPSVVTAVETPTARREQEQEEAEEQTLLVSSGEQRDPEGDQIIVVAAREEVPEPPAVTSTVLAGFGLLGVVPDNEAPDNVDIISFAFDSAVFRRDSDNRGIAIVGLEDDDSGPPQLTLATIDPAAVRGGDNTTEVTRAVTLLDQADPALVSLFEESPASVEEFFFNGEIGFGRWSNGRILIVEEDAGSPGGIFTDVGELSGFESVHFLFGTEPPALPTAFLGTATYAFLDGTQSTSFSGSTIGQGVTSGHIDVNFALSSATLDMNVLHNSVNYAVSGPLSINTIDKTLSDLTTGGAPTVFANGGDCNPCSTFIDAAFAGPAADLFPKYIGLEYDIQASDVIMGVAAFSFSSFEDPVPSGTSTVLAGFGLLGVLPDTGEPDGVGLFGFAFDSAVFRRDSDSRGIGFVGIEDEEEFGTPQLTLATIDPVAVRGGDNTTEVTRAVTLLDQADPTLVSFFEESPASAEEFFFNGEIGYGRWSNGRILIVEEDEGSTSGIFTGVDELSGFQSVHYLLGTEPPTLPTLAGTATYNFFGGTRSTTVSGNTIGTGVTMGHIDVNFGFSSATLDMNVSHDSVNYAVSGDLELIPLDGSFSDMVAGTPSVFTTGGLCIPSCGTVIEGGFVGGPTVSTDFPGYAGLEYNIKTTDIIMGVATFQFDNFTPPPLLSVVQPNSVYIAISPDLDDPEQVHFAAGWDASIFIDGNNNVIGALGTETFEPPDVAVTGDHRVVNTMDLELMQAGDSSTAVAEVNALIAAQDPADQTIIADYTSGATTVADSFLDITDGFGWGRWTSGTILAFDATPGTEENALTGNQSAHYIFGQDPGTIATSGSATYTFVGGTRSTSASGSTIGNGVTTGTIDVNFAGTGSINMSVDHIPDFPYAVSGSLNVLPSEGVVFDNVVTATTSAPGSICSPCDTFIDGGFAGPNISGIPGNIGIEYDIHDTDVVMGVAGFAAP